MPLFKVTLRKGVLTTGQKQSLAGALTDIILEGEVGHVSENGRRAAHVVFNEVDGDTDWFVGGVPAGSTPAPGLIIFEVIYPEAATDAAGRSWLHREINAAAVRILLGADAPANGWLTGFRSTKCPKAVGVCAATPSASAMSPAGRWSLLLASPTRTPGSMLAAA